MQKNLNIEKIAFKVVQMKFLAMHITIKLSFDIFTLQNLQNIFMEHDFWHKRKIVNFDQYNVLFAVAIATKKNTRATYHWFCGPGSHLTSQRTSKPS